MIKTEIYDKLVDIFETVFAASIVLGVTLGLTYALLFGLDYGLEIWLKWSLPTWLFHLIPWGFSAPLTFMMWASGNAHKEYKVQLRDFWVMFAVFVDVDMQNRTSDDREEINEWLEKNATSLCRRLGSNEYIYTYAFLSRVDAVAFKLAWS